jgi:hypothetical protein
MSCRLVSPRTKHESTRSVMSTCVNLKANDPSRVQQNAAERTRRPGTIKDSARTSSESQGVQPKQAQGPGVGAKASMTGCAAHAILPAHSLQRASAHRNTPSPPRPRARTAGQKKNNETPIPRRRCLNYSSTEQSPPPEHQHTTGPTCNQQTNIITGDHNRSSAQGARTLDFKNHYSLLGAGHKP